jgi:cytidylate kinase
MIRISLFDEPGSGKSTLAKILVKKLSCRVVESSTSVVFPIARHFSKLPSEALLLKKLTKLSKTSRHGVSREQALAALGKLHPYRYSAREVLERAGIL